MLLNSFKSMLIIIILDCKLILSQEAEDRLTYICQSNNEATDIL